MPTAKNDSGITLADLEQHYEELKAGRAHLLGEIERAKANLAAQDGAMQECEHWIARLKEQENVAEGED